MRFRGIMRFLKLRPGRVSTRPTALSVLTAPFAYAFVVPLFMLDASLWLYQHVCFPVLRIAKVPRGRYIVFDRERLTYLGPVRKLSCRYCSYATGVMAYATEVLARSEQYFCPIKHMRPPESQHSRYAHFAEFGSASSLRREARRLRTALRHPGHEGGE
jgi:hypothetical protein